MHLLEPKWLRAVKVARVFHASLACSPAKAASNHTSSLRLHARRRNRWPERKPVGFGLVVIDAVEVAVGGVRVFERPQAGVVV